MSPFSVLWSPIIFGFALFLGAGLLALAQPMIGKTILPHLGGSPLAWSVCLVFFQAIMLVGFVYADLLHRFRGLRWQPWLQIVALLTLAFLCFAGALGDRVLVPLAPRLSSFDSWPILSVICLLSVVLGLPLLVLAAVVPLVQRWFAHLDHPRASDPYFLFVAASLGGLAALTIYVMLIEPEAPLRAQWMSWKLALTALSVMLFIVALCVWRSPRNPELEPPVLTDPNAPLIPHLIGRGQATWPRRLYWLAAAGLPMGMLASVTNYLTVDFAPTPIFWTLPLALFLLALAQAFGRWTVFEDKTGVGRLLLRIALGLLLGSLFVLLVKEVMRGNHETESVTFFCIALLVGSFLIPFNWLGVIQPACVLLAAFLQVNAYRPTDLSAPLILLHLLTFYFSVRLCFGMLAKDRPAATALTTYFVWIGIGGLCGTLFQVILVPWLFRTAYLEFYFLAALACTFWPAWATQGRLDWLYSRLFLKEQSDQRRQSVTCVLDFGVPLLIACTACVLFYCPPRLPFAHSLLHDTPLLLGLAAAVATAARPLRFGLALAAVVLMAQIGQFSHHGDNLAARARSVYGIHEIAETHERAPLAGAVHQRLGMEYTQRTLTQSGKLRGICLTNCDELARCPAGHLQRNGPIGIVMGRMEWFRPTKETIREDNALPFPQRKYRDNARDDARIVAALVGMGATPTSGLDQLTTCWTEPPYAFIGLGTGTLFTYARPFQCVDAYELDPAIAALSTDEPPMFQYYDSARKRGVQAHIKVGDARRHLSGPGRGGFYHVIFVDGCHGEALPTHLVNLQAIELYFQKLAPEGIVCVHTSNRYVDLVKVLDRIAQELDLSIRILQSREDWDAPFFLSSEWVVFARNETVMNKWEKAAGGFDHVALGGRGVPFDRGNRLLWTDERASVLAALHSGKNWIPLLQGMLSLILIIGIAFGLIEMVLAMQGRSRAIEKSSLAPKR